MNAFESYFNSPEYLLFKRANDLLKSAQCENPSCGKRATSSANMYVLKYKKGRTLFKIKMNRVCCKGFAMILEEKAFLIDKSL